jgi:hypothetical protein
MGVRTEPTVVVFFRSMTKLFLAVMSSSEAGTVVVHLFLIYEGYQKEDNTS